MHRLMAAAMALLLTLPAAANEIMDREVQHLLQFVENSGCTFTRNGTNHDAAGAADHLRLKYNRGGRYVKSADQFIERLASESSWTGKPYTVTCDGLTRPSGEWLQEALQAYRASPDG